MKWDMTQPKIGDMIRVKAGNVWHYGIYVSDEEVIQFGVSPVLAGWQEADKLQVLATDIDDFLQGEFLEVASLDKKQAKKRFSVQKTVDTARSRIGQKGYDILHNNCEHFVYECVFGEHTSSQVDDIRKQFSTYPVLNVYYAWIQQDMPVQNVYPKERMKYIDKCTNQTLKTQRYAVWKLLEYALKDSFGLQFDKLKFKLEKSGRWVCDNFCFSLSHTKGAVAVAVSKNKVGVDIEIVKAPVSGGIFEKVLTPSEAEHICTLPESEKNQYFITKWTQKESAFKESGESVFSPAEIQVSNVKSFVLEHGDDKYCLSAVGADIDKVQLYGDISI